MVLTDVTFGTVAMLESDNCGKDAAAGFSDTARDTAAATVCGVFRSSLAEVEVVLDTGTVILKLTSRVPPPCKRRRLITVPLA